MNKLSVSVLMPIYNPRPDDLKRAIISVINQTYNHDLMKFIIIDDGSTNNSYKIAKTYQKKYNWISVYRHANNSGLCYTINKLICLCKSHYFVLLDVDDWYYPFAIEQLIRCSENGECDVVVGKTKYLYKAHFKKWPFSLRNNVFSKNTNKYEYITYNCDLGSWNKMWRTRIIKNNFVNFKMWNYGNDSFFNYYYFNFVSKFGKCLKYTYIYSLNSPTSTSQKMANNSMNFIVSSLSIAFFNTFNLMFSKYHIPKNKYIVDRTIFWILQSIYGYYRSKKIKNKATYKLIIDSMCELLEYMCNFNYVPSKPKFSLFKSWTKFWLNYNKILNINYWKRKRELL